MHQAPLRGRPVLAGKKVLLVDPYQPTRDARAGVLRNHDIELDIAESLHAARRLWRPRFYDWVLLDVRAYLPGEALGFYEQIRDKSPHERVAFFVGPPTYLSRTWPDESSEFASGAQQWGETVKSLLAAA
jgi:response regulator RpfG family c-di-GMP phosphodiesterase